MKRIIASVLAAALLLLPLCSCSSVQHIKDTNGAEDTSLCTLTEEELVSPHPKCLTQGSSISHYKNMVYFLPLKMSGVKTLDKFTVKAGETYEFTGAVTVNSGLRKPPLDNRSAYSGVDYSYRNIKLLLKLFCKRVRKG